MELKQTSKDKDLMKMMSKFKKLNKKEQGFILGLAEGFLLCKSKPKIRTTSKLNLKSE